MRKLARGAALTVALLAPAAVPAVAEAACSGADHMPDRASVASVRGTTICLLNEVRRRHGLGRLRANVRLERAAQGHSRAMATHHFFSHVSAVTGQTALDRVRRAGYLRGARGWSVGENIVWGTGSLATPRMAVRVWMGSPPHRHNILTARWRQIGVGVALGAPKAGVSGVSAATYTTNFGVRA